MARRSGEDTHAFGKLAADSAVKESTIVDVRESVGDVGYESRSS